ncbi:hypothetical protein [Rhodospira trueperi]|uniref:Carboxypeptidase regulatory-like domain-containing protein n=1 Tax=Rhodospira trueperi TaxID=69960 RepID=A0A1G7CFV4_9PROT|nr:hypothetical protein [Rhodospira trueperi]SDE38141.1 hypothetical protein SAMN05421720_10660 [Rhodospira trueperi]
MTPFRRLSALTLGAALMLAPAGAALAHTPLFSCYDNGDGTVLCEAGFSDGSSASGVPVQVLDGTGAVIEESKMDANSEFIFEMPEGDYSVQFDAGEGHRIKVPAAEIY